MLSQKVLVGTVVQFLLILAVGSAGLTESPQTQTFTYREKILRLRNGWRVEAQEAMNGAANQVQHNLLLVLAELGKDTFKASRFIKFSIHTLINGMVNRTFDYAGILASTPKLLTEALPTQLVAILRGIQKQPSITPELNATISTVVEFIMKAEQSGVSQNIFRPATNVVPNLLSGVNTFLVSLLNRFFYIIGARDPNELYGTSTNPPNSTVPQ